MLHAPEMPPAVVTGVIPPVNVVKAHLFEALHDVRLLKQLLKLSEAAEKAAAVKKTIHLSSLNHAPAR